MCVRPLQIATLRKKKSRPIRSGGRQMRWLVVIFWPPYPIYYNTIMRTWPPPMIWWRTSKKYLGNRIMPVGKWLWGHSSIRRCQREPRLGIMFWRWSLIWMNRRSLELRSTAKAKSISCSCRCQIPIRTSTSITLWVKETIQIGRASCRERVCLYV